MNELKPLYALSIDTPVEPLVAVLEEGSDALVRLDFIRPDDSPRQPLWRGLPVVWRRDGGTELIKQIHEYFSGERKDFDVILRPRGGGEFDRIVWRELSALAPFGTTVTYGEIARRLNRPKAARAVGHANATNPISLIVPCHRVVGSGGRLVGYGGGKGVSTKQQLISFEERISHAREYLFSGENA